MADKLTVGDIEVPEGMLEVACVSICGGVPDVDVIRQRLALALLWLATNPVVPPEEVVDSLTPIDKGFVKRAIRNDVACACTEWQRRMFLRKPDPVPEEVKALMWDRQVEPQSLREEHNEDVLAAVEIGRRLEREAR